MTSCTKPLMGTEPCASDLLMGADKVDVDVWQDDRRYSSESPVAAPARNAVRKAGGMSCGHHISPSVLTAWSMSAHRSDGAKIKTVMHLTDRLIQQRTASWRNLGVAVFLSD